MRLTLRTLLAYLDDILEPADSDEINRKIEESKFAGELVHRIRNSTRRMRLGAPKLDGRGVGLDPNSVAEYLDNTLPTEHVPEFEKVCLESDVHLAEVASCHQILTLVLGQPADIGESLRARVYAIGSGEGDTANGPSAAPPPAAPPITQTSDVAAASPSPSDWGDELPATEPARAAVPDYLRAGSQVPVKSLLIIVACAFVLAVVALRAMGPFGREHPVWQFLAGSPETQVTDRSAERAADPSEPSDATGEELFEAPTDTASPDTAKGPPVESEVREPPVAPAPAPSPSPDPAAETSPPVAPATVPDAPPADAMESSGPATEPAAKDPPSPETVDAMVGEGDAPTEVPIPAKVAPAASLGRYISEEQVLGWLDTERAAWYRAEPDSSLLVGHRLLSMPTSRPQLLLAPNAKLTLSGATSVLILAPAQAAAPRVRVDFGRVVVVSATGEETRIQLDLPGRSGTALLSDAESALAIEVMPDHQLGADPQSAARGVAMRLMAASGEVTWQEAAESVGIGAGQVLVFVDNAPGQILSLPSVPDWLAGTDVTEIDARASQELRRHLPAGRPLSLSLLEKTEFRQQEVRALACRCLAVLDIYKPTFEAFDDEDQHAYWDAHFDALRASVNRFPESASRLMAELQKEMGEDAEPIYRLLWGYTPDQLAAGADAELVDLLEHEQMLARVLAYENLRRITGKTLLFRPEQPPGQEKTKVLKWRKALEEGEVRYKTPPPAVPGLGDTLEPPAAAAEEASGP